MDQTPNDASLKLSLLMHVPKVKPHLDVVGEEVCLLLLRLLLYLSQCFFPLNIDIGVGYSMLAKYQAVLTTYKGVVAFTCCTKMCTVFLPQPSSINDLGTCSSVDQIWQLGKGEEGQCVSPNVTDGSTCSLLSDSFRPPPTQTFLLLGQLTV